MYGPKLILSCTPNSRDAFKGTNVMSIVVEVPKSKLGGSGTLNVWAESKKAIN